MASLQRIQSIILALVVLLTLSGCSPSPVSAVGPNKTQPTSTPLPDDNYSSERDALLSDIHDTMAPNGWWGVWQDGTSTGNVKVVRKIDLSIQASIPISPALGPYVLYGSWSPDSRKLLMHSYDEVYSHAPVSRLIILHFDYAHGELIPYVYRLSYPIEEQYMVPIVHWSYDSEKLAICGNGREIIILDAKGHVLKKYRPYLPQRATIESLMWRPNDELLYTVSYRIKVN